MQIVLKLPHLSVGKDLWSDNTIAALTEQLTQAGRTGPDRRRYKLSVVIKEGMHAPVKDIDNYVKPVLDAIKDSRLLWEDDSQIDETHIWRTSSKMDKSKMELLAEDL